MNKTSQTITHNRFDTSGTCAGYITRVNLRKGFDFLIYDYQVKTNHVLESFGEKPLLGIGFCLSGSMEGELKDVQHNILTKGGQSQFFAFPNQIGTVKDHSGSHRRTIGLLIEPEVLYSLLNEDLDQLPRPLRAFIAGEESRYYGFQGKIPPASSMLYEQVISCQWTGATRRLFFESKALEILATMLRQVKKNPDPYPVGFSRTETDRLYETAELLHNSLEHPPSLFQLARNAGMSHVKLNKGFRSLFGTTVFGYLRKVRLEKARQLLEKQHIDVTSAALTVGYNSLPAFSRAFLLAYGYSPGTAKKNKVA